MISEFVQSLEPQLSNTGYKTNPDPILPGIRGLFSAVSPKITSVGPIKFINYYLFLNWDNDLFGRLDSFIAAQKSYKEVVKKDFNIPNAWRMTIPNMVVAAISVNAFPKATVEYVQKTYQIPFTGGEIGQMMLFDLENHAQICHFPHGYKQYGSIPLGYAVDELFEMFKVFMPDSKCYMQ